MASSRGRAGGDGTWDEFVRRHAATLWACDFFSKKVWTLGGLVDVFVRFFIHLGTRRVHLAGLTAHPDRAWVAQQARNTALALSEQPVKPEILLLDHDAKFVPEFDRVFAAEGIQVKRVGPRAPNLNAYAERWVQAVKQEYLDHFVVFGEGHLRHLLREYVAHYNEERPHQGRDNLPLGGAGPDPGGGVVVCRERLGGLLKHYSRRAA
jgi:putative transposase